MGWGNLEFGYLKLRLGGRIWNLCMNGILRCRLCSCVVQIRLAGGGARAMEGDVKLFFEISFDKELL